MFLYAWGMKQEHWVVQRVRPQHSYIFRAAKHKYDLNFALSDQQLWDTPNTENFEISLLHSKTVVKFQRY